MGLLYVFLPMVIYLAVGLGPRMFDQPNHCGAALPFNGGFRSSPQLCNSLMRKSTNQLWDQGICKGQLMPT